MQEWFIAWCAGLLVGILFALLRLPIPAPPMLSGVLGVVGIFCGGLLGQWILQRFFS
ncbi:hypothetical protein VST7929_00663 [Vibrio stylophorae]|uniref:XapX domain-containing protein n=1 Tax=Vibrio stylophorae TaxID=659351 RepID=A0ABN8DNQ9_9VIBR|nr:DUF1427 family protein [Vibrio stylophorae]CAH0532816.1 hypothetical protein VST7929_00663 [Vibrio stylophorae]